MKEPKIHYKNIPPHFPTLPTMIIYLLVDKYKVPEFWLGVIWLILSLWWVGSIITIFNSKFIDIFKKEG